MHYFLVAAVIGFFGYLLIGHLERHELLDQPRYKLGGITVDLTRGATLWVARALTILLIAIITICVMYFHDTLVGPTMSSQRWPVVSGLTFGLLAAIWTRSVLANPAQVPLSSGQLLAVAALALLFLTGGLSDVFNRYIDKVQQVSLPGGISLVFATTEVAPAKSSYSFTGDPLPSFGSDYVADKGLEYLGALDAIIQQDCIYVEKAGSPPGTKLPSPGCGSNDRRVKELQPIRTFFRIGLSSHARCVAAVYTQFGDKEFWRNQIVSIAPFLRIIEDRRSRAGNQAYPPEAVSEAFTTSLSETSMRLIGGLAAPGATTVYPAAERVLAEAQPDLQIPHNCSDLLLVACAPDAEIDPWLSGTKSDWVTTNPDIVTKCVADVNRGMKDDAHRAELDTIRQRYAGRLKKHADAVFKKIDDEIANRPYLTIANLLFVSQLQSTPLGLQSLNAWITQFEASPASGSSKSMDNPWLSIAARNFLFVFAEYTIDQVGATPLFVDAHLKNWEDQFKLELSGGLRDYLDILRRPKRHGLEAILFDWDCEFDKTESPMLAMRARNIVAAAAHNFLTYIERAAANPLLNVRAAEVETEIDNYLQWLATADLACTETERNGSKAFGYGPRTIRAAAFYWIAQRAARSAQQLAEARGSREENAASKDEAKKTLGGASALAEKGLNLVRKVSDADTRERENDYLKMPKATDAMRTAARLTRLLEDIKKAQGQLK